MCIIGICAGGRCEGSVHVQQCLAVAAILGQLGVTVTQMCGFLPKDVVPEPVAIVKGLGTVH